MGNFGQGYFDMGGGFGRGGFGGFGFGGFGGYGARGLMRPVHGLGDVAHNAVMGNSAGFINAAVSGFGRQASMEVAHKGASLAHRLFNPGEDDQPPQGYQQRGGMFPQVRGFGAITGQRSYTSNGRSSAGHNDTPEVLLTPDQEEHLFIAKRRAEAAKLDTQIDAEKDDTKRTQLLGKKTLLEAKPSTAESLTDYVTYLEGKMSKDRRTTDQDRAELAELKNKIYDNKGNEAALAEIKKDLTERVKGVNGGSQGNEQGAVDRGGDNRQAFASRGQGGSKYDSPVYGPAHTPEYPKSNPIGTFFHGGLTPAQRAYKKDCEARGYDPEAGGYDGPLAYNDGGDRGAPAQQDYRRTASASQQRAPRAQVVMDDTTRGLNDNVLGNDEEILVAKATELGGAELARKVQGEMMKLKAQHNGGVVFLDSNTSEALAHGKADFKTVLSNLSSSLGIVDQSVAAQNPADVAYAANLAKGGARGQS